MNALTDEQRQPAFLSSLSDGLENLRAELRAECGNDLWVAEIDRNDLRSKHPLEIVDECVDMLKRSDLFICVLGGSERALQSGGTPIEAGGIKSLVSYFEIEIFQAALNQIPVIFLERTNFAPGTSMEEFLRVLRRSAVVTRWISGLPSDSSLQIRAHVKALIRDRETLRAAAAQRLRGAAGDLVTRLLAARGQLDEVLSGGSDMLWMQGDRIRVGSGDQATLDRARAFLAVAQAEKRHDRRLSRLYLALRELMPMFYLESSDREALELWNTCFNLWCGSAAWYGLHNHVAIGVIGGLWSQRLIREKLRAQVSATEHSPDHRPPFGALASAYLSLGKLCPNYWTRWRVCRAGIKLATDVIKSDAESDPGIFAVRGSLFFAQLRPFRGMQDFRELLVRAKRNPENLALNAEAHLYVGRGYATFRMPRTANQHLQEAVRTWRAYVDMKQSGEEFLVKALKHLLAFQIQAHQYEKAAATGSEALRISVERRIFDQARQIEELVLKHHLAVDCGGRAVAPVD